MRRRNLFWITSWLALGLSACTAFRPATVQPPRPLEPEKACAEWRWIGISRAGARCPEAEGWTVRPLFPQVTTVPACYGEEQKTPGPEVIQNLARFCVYETANPKKTLKHRSSPPVVSPDLVRLDQDCAALSVSAVTAPAPEKWEDESKKFLEQAGKPEETLQIKNRFGVRLAFLDTHPDGEGAPQVRGNSPHGYTLAHLARHLVCSKPYGPCAAQITTRLAMPIIEFNPKKPVYKGMDPKMGGFLGMQSDLAQAIRDEVDSWRNQESQGHLVLNVSMAWDGDLFGGLDQKQVAEMRAGTQAVYRALEYASGFDVLVLAAAGNKKRQPCVNTGPLLPAAWEGEGLWQKCCGQGQSCCGQEPGCGREKPLVYAVGGVGADGDPLPNARPGGMPRQSAYGANAVVPSWKPGVATAMLTGSSVATTVVSAIAAIVWDTRPDLSSHEVMDLLYRNGDDLSIPADFGAGLRNPDPSSRNVHRLSLCRALKAACDDDPSKVPFCPIQGDCKKWVREPSDPDYHPTILGACQPWTFPQPEDPPCPACIRDQDPPGGWRQNL